MLQKNTEEDRIMKPTTRLIKGKDYDYHSIVNQRGFVMLNKLTECKLVPLVADDVVVDIGAYVGEYSLYASHSGVKEVRSYEASPATFEVLSMNQRDNMSIHNKAVVGDDATEVALFLAKAGSAGVTNSIAKKKKHAILVPAIKYEDAIKDATVVKIDVEGAEYGYNIIQPWVRAYILEFHTISDYDWKGHAERLINEFRAAGFIELSVPKFQHGFDMHGAWIKAEGV